MSVAALQPAANQSRVQQLAHEGLARQGGQTFQNARTIGDRYLGSIASEADGSLEGVIASVAKGASGKYMYPQSAYHTQNFALKALAAGVGGPVGPALASIGHDGMYKTVWHEASMAYKDGRSIGESFLDGIKAHSDDPNEKLLAGVARSSAAQYLYNKTAFNVEAEALQRIAQGVQGQAPERMLAEFGRAARMKAVDNENARKIAYPVLEAISSSSDPRAAAIGEVGRAASGAYLHQDAGSLAQDTAFVKILEAPKGNLAQDLADFGTRALRNCSYAEDQRHIGHEVLRGIARHTSDPATKLLAQAADNATCPMLYNRSAAGAQFEAFGLLAGGAASDPDKLLAQYGLAVHGRGDTTHDSRIMGHEVLKALAGNESDEVKKGILESALQMSTDSAADTVSMGVQRFAFNWVQKAPSLPRPLPDAPGGTPDAAVLEQRIGVHTSIHEMLDAEVTRLNRDMTDKQARMTRLADQFNPMVGEEERLLKHAGWARKAFFAGAGVGVAGLLGRGFLPPAVSLVMMGVGGLAAVASQFVGNHVRADRGELLARYWPLRNAYDQLEGERQALGATSVATERMAGKIEEAIQKDRGQLEVVKMSQVVNEPPKPAGEVKIDADEITIGGIKIRKRNDAPGQDKDAPAVSLEGTGQPAAEQPARLPDAPGAESGEAAGGRA